MIENKTIFISGGSGFIGTTMCERLLRDNKIIIYDVMREGRNSLEKSSIKNHENLTVIKSDILDKEKLKESLTNADIILHLAAIAGVSSYYQKPEETMKINLLGTLNILDTIVENKLSPELFVDFSTSETYGNEGYNATESQVPSTFVTTDDRGSYSIAKLASERLSFIYGKKYNFKILVVKPFNIYGPGQLGEGAIANFINSSLKNETIKITGDGTAVRAWCYINDFVDCLLSAIEKRGEYDAEILNIGNPHEIETTLSLARKVIKLSESNSQIEFVPHIGTEINVRIPNIRKANKMFNYFPKVDMEEGLKRTIEWYRSLI